MTYKLALLSSLLAIGNTAEAVEKLSAGRVTALPTLVEVSNQKSGTPYCGWIGVQVKPMTGAFAKSLGMVEPFGAIFDQPEQGSPAAEAGIEEGDVITAINGSSLSHSSEFAITISQMARGSLINLTTFRDGQLMEKQLMIGSSKCPD